MQIFSHNDLAAEYNSLRQLKERDAVNEIMDFLASPPRAYVAALCGLGSTGKTVALKHAFDKLSNKNEAVYITIDENDITAKLQQTINKLIKRGVKTFFIDEITLMDDFIDLSNTFSDGYAARGIKLVFSGTSLGLMLASKRNLFNRAELIHTTWIPWREYSRILPECDFEDYIKSGGILFDRIDDYINTAIFHNLQNSLDNDHHGINWGNLANPRYENRLQGMLQRVIADEQHRFIINILNKYKNYDTDIDAITEKLKSRLAIINSKNMPTEDQMIELQGHLELMDFFEKCPNSDHRNLLVQTGLRWAQTLALFDELQKDLDDSLKTDKNIVFEKLEQLVLGKIVEDNILLDAIRTLREYKIYPLSFSPPRFDTGGEIAMVIEDRKNRNMDAFGINLGSTPCGEHLKHLRDKEYLAYTDKNIQKRRYNCILYSGDEYMEFDGAMYLNISDFLKNIADYEQYMEDKYQYLKETRE